MYTSPQNSLVSFSGKIAIVTLLSTARESAASDEGLAERIRRYIESSPISKSWTVDKVTVLEDASTGSKAAVASLGKLGDSSQF